MLRQAIRLGRSQVQVQIRANSELIKVNVDSRKVGYIELNNPPVNILSRGKRSSDHRRII